MSGFMELARELGGHLARTDEYQALRRAASAADDDRELVEARNAIERLEASIEAELRAGREPPSTLLQEYEDTVSRLQGSPVYQRLVAAQANFDKVMMKVNEMIARGMEEGAASRIVLP